jgi:hypothetical protein
MIATDIPLESQVCWWDEPSKKGRVIYNTCLQGDQVVAVEWNDGKIEDVNVNDLHLLHTFKDCSWR